MEDNFIKKINDGLRLHTIKHLSVTWRIAGPAREGIRQQLMEERNTPNIRFSFIVPVYNRPAEVRELLESLTNQTVKDFEVLIVEDGSTIRSDGVYQEFEGKLDLEYFFKPNTGPGDSRNYGFKKASGNYCIFVDSDCILPEQYFETIQRTLTEDYADAFGGPDKAHADFTVLQKAINYSMTSFFTTGGIRGSSEKLAKFQPRSFNMGFSREVFDKTDGFPNIRFAKNKAAGEDLDLSIQIQKLGFKTTLIPDAYVYHKRRTSLKQFFNQVFGFGYARVTVSRRHPESLKLLHLAPCLFTLGVIGLLILSVVYSRLFLLPIVVHVALIAIDSSLKNKNILIGLMSVVTSYTQLLGYGLGFINAAWKHLILRKDKI